MKKGIKKILFIKASRPTKYNRLVTFPLGIMYLISYLKKIRDDLEFRIVDLRLSAGREEQVLRDALLEFKPDIAGISAITLESPSMKWVASRVKKFDNSCLVICGGPHPTAYPEEVLSDRNVDYIVSGEGEVVFANLISALIDGGEISNLKGIGYREDNTCILTPPDGYIDDLDGLPFPAWEYADAKKYFHLTSMSNYGRRRYANIFTSRACPYRCIYCHNIFGKGFRVRSVDNVIDELKYLKKKFGILEAEVIDDVFNLDMNRAREIFTRSIRENLGISFSFPNGLRGDRIDPELIKLMKEAGTLMITVAVESASSRIQQLIRKNLDLPAVRKAIENCDRAGLLTRGFFMMGFPDETEDEIKTTVDFAVESRLHIAMFYIAVPFRGTEMHDLVKERLKDTPHKSDDYEYVASRFNFSGVETKKLHKLQSSAYRRFYLQPWRWWKILKLSPYKGDLIRYLPSVISRFSITREEVVI